MLNKSYVLITAARNEEAYIEKTIKSIINQTMLPEKWVIVSDGSTDCTDEIVNEYAKVYDFIKLLHINREGKRNFGAMADAFNEGSKMLKQIRYEFIGSLDADISFEPDYYERVLEKFQMNIRLGLAGGFIYEKYKGEFKSRRFNSLSSVPHAIQLFRRECYESFGGYIPLKYGGTDWCAEVMARMKGWHVEVFPELRVFHHRHTSATSPKDSFRQGLKDYSIGSHPLFEVFKCIYRIKGKIFLISASLRMVGFLWGYMKIEKRIVSDKFIKYLRKEQIQRLRAFLC